MADLNQSKNLKTCVCNHKFSVSMGCGVSVKSVEWCTHCVEVERVARELVGFAARIVPLRFLPSRTEFRQWQRDLAAINELARSCGLLED